MALAQNFDVPIPRGMLESLRYSGNQLENKIETLCTMLYQAKNENTRLCREIDALGGTIQDLKTKSDASPFVLFLIDGDNTLFLDRFVQKGVDGGSEAAQALKVAVEAYLKQHVDFQTHWEIVIRIYVNLTGLSKVYANLGLVDDAGSFRKFVMGFNRQLRSCEFIDAGDDKEATDNKIRENFKRFWLNQNCRHILLSGSADRGYVSFLREFSDRASRFTLVESIRFERVFEKLATQFGIRTCRFDGLFSNTKLNSPERTGNQATIRKSTYAFANPLSGATNARGLNQSGGVHTHPTPSGSKDSTPLLTTKLNRH